MPKSTFGDNDEHYVPPSPAPATAASPPPTDGTDPVTGALSTILNLIPSIDPNGKIEKGRAVLRALMQTPIPDLATQVLPIGGGLIRDPVHPNEGTLENALESAPVVGGILGSDFGIKGAALGAAGGESLRQNVRRALGFPSSTGMVQRAIGADPDSPDAAVAGMGGEAAASVPAGLVSGGLDAMSRFFRRGSLRSYINLLKPETPRDTGYKAMSLAQRMYDEGMIPFGTGREHWGGIASHPVPGRGGTHEMPGTALDALHDARADNDATIAQINASGGMIPVKEVMNKVTGFVPDILPSGGIPEVGRGQRTGTERVVRDLNTLIGGRTEIPFHEALAERQRLDDMLSKYYKGGSDAQLEGERGAIQNAADAWRDALHTQFPHLGVKDQRLSDLITINELLGSALEASQSTPALAPYAHSKIGAALHMARSGSSTGPIASMSGPAKLLLSRLLGMGRDSAEAFVRIGDQFNAGSGPPPNPGDKPALDTLIGDVTGQKQNATVQTHQPTEDDFVRRYQQ